MKLYGTLVADKIVPTDSQDTFPTHDEEYGLGGYRSVATIAERDAISADRRKEGMKVFVRDEDLEYQLKGGIDNTHWELGVKFNIESLPDLDPVYLTDYVAVSRNGVMYKTTVGKLLNAIGTSGCKVTYNGEQVTYNGEELGYECKGRVWYNGEQVTYNTEEVTN